jgi:predicted RNA-binding protein YlxR (DUF448 family)
MLVQAASGLERLVVGNRDNAIFKDSTVAQISAYIYYEASVISKLTKNKAFQQKFSKTIFDQIKNDFPSYIDSQARIKPRSLHHVYEWKKTGEPTSRLFTLNKLSQDGLSFTFDYEFLPSRNAVPTKLRGRKHVFVNKASVMERGEAIQISPRSAERLVFEIDGMTVFMPKGASVTVKRPGGTSVKNSFDLLYSRYFSGQLINETIKKSGFQRLFNTSMSKALSVPNNIKRVQYSFSSNAIRSQADIALTQAFGGAL